MNDNFISLFCLNYLVYFELKLALDLYEMIYVSVVLDNCEVEM